MKLKENSVIIMTIEISIESGKDSTSTLSLVIHRWDSKKTCKKSTVAFKGGGDGVKLRKPSILMVLEFHPIFHFS